LAEEDRDDEAVLEVCSALREAVGDEHVTTMQGRQRLGFFPSLFLSWRGRKDGVERRGEEDEWLEWSR
jgi:hypothetical protein